MKTVHNSKKFDISNSLRRAAVIGTLSMMTMTIPTAASPNIPIRISPDLVLSLDREHQHKLAEDDKTPTPIIAALAKSKYNEVRKAAGFNRNLDIISLERLAMDSICEVRHGPSMETKNPDLLDKLAKVTDCPVVIWHVARNPQTRIPILIPLLNNKDKDVVSEAVENIKYRIDNSQLSKRDLKLIAKVNVRELSDAAIDELTKLGVPLEEIELVSR